MLKTKEIKRFTEEQFNKSSVDEILVTPRKKIMLLDPKDEFNKKFYRNFYESLGLYLTKLPNNNVKNQVQNIYNKNMIYVGVTYGAKPVSLNIVFEKVLIRDGFYSGSVLNALALGIDLTTDEITRIDDCVYVSYYSLIRAAILLNKLKIKNNKDLHKLLTTYMYLIFLKILGKNTLYSKKQKQLIHMCCIYIYYIYFFKQTHSYALNVIKKDHLDNIDLEIYDEFVRLIKENKGYDNIKDIPKLLYDLKLSFEDPKKAYVKMFQILGPKGFYTFIAPYDQFVASMILTKYPTSLFTKSSLTVAKIHDSVEEIINKYIDKIKYKKMSL